MSKILLKSLLISPAALAAALAVSASAIATEAKATSEAVLPQATALQSQALAAAPQVSTLDVAPEASVGAAVSLEQKTLPVKIASTPVAQSAASDSAKPTADVSENSLSQINQYTREGRSSNQAGQVTSVSQLSDVRPTDWAFQALQSLVERYGCIAGYPDRTYKGNRAMTRYEFAAGLNACMDRVNELIAAGTADLVKKEDLAVLQRLQEEFAAELATLRGRVDALEARTSTLEKQQFSTTTKLAGEVIFGVTDEFLQPRNNNTVFQDRVRLTLNTSFTGKDLLVTRLAAGNFVPFRFQGGTGAEGLQTFQFGSTGSNSVYADWVAYYFPIGEKLQVYIPAFAGLQYDYAPTQAGLMEGFDSGTGPIGYFAQRNPIYDIGGGSGLGLNFNLTKNFTVSLGYLADNSNATFDADGNLVTGGTASANNPADKAGLFNGSYAALGQIAFKSDRFSFGLTYVNAYRQGAIFGAGGGGPVVGTAPGNLLFTNAGGGFTSTRLNAYGVSGSFNLSRNISVNAFGSYIQADKVRDGIGEGEIWTYGLGVAFADFGKKGNLLGLMAGVEPYLGNTREFNRGGSAVLRNNDLPIHLEAFYRYQLTDNISITPGVIYLINPGQNSNNEDALIGTLRTTFTF